MNARILLLLVGLLALWPGVGHAQHGYPPLPDVASSMASCLTQKIGMPTEVYDTRFGYLIEIRLKGDPSANQDVQTPWPPKDTIAFVTLDIEVPEPTPLPSQHVVRVWGNGAPEYVVARNHGWFTFGIAAATRYCLTGALGQL